jgi:hypothetical protein
MELSDETFVSVDIEILPEHVRAALMEFWDDNESEQVNLSHVLHWLRNSSIQVLDD